MEELKLYKLPDLPYSYDALVPFMSQEQLRLKIFLLTFPAIFSIRSFGKI